MFLYISGSIKTCFLLSDSCEKIYQNDTYVLRSATGIEYSNFLFPFYMISQDILWNICVHMKNPCQTLHYIKPEIYNEQCALIQNKHFIRTVRLKIYIFFKLSQIYSYIIYIIYSIYFHDFRNFTALFVVFRTSLALEIPCLAIQDFSGFLWPCQVRPAGLPQIITWCVVHYGMCRRREQSSCVAGSDTLKWNVKWLSVG